MGLQAYSTIFPGMKPSTQPHKEAQEVLPPMAFKDEIWLCVMKGIDNMVVFRDEGRSREGKFFFPANMWSNSHPKRIFFFFLCCYSKLWLGPSWKHPTNERTMACFENDRSFKWECIQISKENWNHSYEIDIWKYELFQDRTYLQIDIWTYETFQDRMYIENYIQK